MGATANYPYQCVISSLGVETWIFGENPSMLFPYMAHTYLASDEISYPKICYVPDARASGLIIANQNVNIGTSDIRYEITREPAQNNEGLSDVIVTFYRMVSDQKVVIDTYSLELYKLQTEAKVKNISAVNWLNFYVNVNPSDKSITGVGLAVWVSYTDKNENEFYNAVLSTPITNQAVIDAITLSAEVRELPGYYGSYADVLEGSNDFKLTHLPDDYLNKYVWSNSHNKYSETVCEIDNSVGYDMSASFKQSLGTNVWKPNNNPNILMRNIALAIKNNGGSLGSDLLRRTSNGGFTNGVDLDQTELIMGVSGGQLSYEIQFSGGWLTFECRNPTYNSGYTYIAIYDANHNLIDSYRVLDIISGAISSAPVGQTNINWGKMVLSLYLVHDGSRFHLYGLKQFADLYDDDGNRIEYVEVFNRYDTACFFQKLYTFNQQAQEILDSASKSLFLDDPTYQPEDSESASLPDNMSDIYDRDSTWETGDEAGENKGVRYSGDSNVNPTDLQKTVAEDIPGGHQPVEDPDTPGHIPTPINTGMINILAPTDSQMSDFASDIRSDTFLQAISNYFSNPMDIVVSAHTCIAPTLNNGSDKYLQYGLWTSNYTMKALKQQYYKVSMGEKNIPEFTASFADYPPYSNYIMYLPYIGFRQIDGNHVVGRNLKLYYYIDVATGEILAELLYKDMASGNGCPIGYYSGNTLARFPLKSVDYSSIISNVVSGVFSTASAIGQFAKGDVAGGVMSMVGGASKVMSGGLSPDINMNGTVSGSMTYTMYDTPFLIRTAPHLYNMLPDGYKHLKGMPSNTGIELGKVLKMQSQFIQFDNIDLDGIVNEAGEGALQIEKEEILRLLQEGVYTK